MNQENELTDSLMTVMKNNTIKYRGVVITKIGGKFHFLRQEVESLERAKELIDELWAAINAKIKKS